MLTLSSIFLSLALITSPLYFFSSGLPQLTDFLFILFIFCYSIVIVTKSNHSLHLKKIPLAWVLLVIWIVIVQLTWLILRNSTEYLMHLSFWVYNLTISLFIISYVINCKSMILIKNSLYLASLLSFSGVVIDFFVSFRVTGFFNNPNQLAYFSILSICITLLIEKFRISFYSLPFLSIFACGLSILASLSMTSIVGLAIIMLAYIIANFRMAYLMKTIFILACIISLFTFIPKGDVYNNLVTNLELRFEQKDRKIEIMYEDRGYNRIRSNPQYLIFGAGEGEYQRFSLRNTEIHSNYANILFSYGFIGFTFFILLLINVIWKQPIPVLIVIVAPLAYGITHMGLRFTLFWIFIAVLILAKRYKLSVH